MESGKEERVSEGSMVQVQALPQIQTVSGSALNSEPEPPALLSLPLCKRTIKLLALLQKFYPILQK